MSPLKYVTMGDNVKFYYWTIDIPVWLFGTIVDLETTGLHPKESELVALGLVKNNRMSVFIRPPEEPETNFLIYARDKVSRCPRPWIGYYHPFETKWLSKFGNGKRWNFDIELQPHNRHKKIYAVKLQHLGHENVSGIIIPEAWEAKNLLKIAWHLASDLFEELALYVTLSHETRMWKHPLEDFRQEEFFRE